LRPILILFSSRGPLLSSKGSFRCQGSIAPQANHSLPACGQLIFEGARGTASFPYRRHINRCPLAGNSSSKGLRGTKPSPYPAYNIVTYNLLLVPLQGSPNTLLFASTLNVLLPYDNVDTIDALFVA
jgi:hypothetical protein